MQLYTIETFPAYKSITPVDKQGEICFLFIYIVDGVKGRSPLEKAPQGHRKRETDGFATNLK